MDLKYLLMNWRKYEKILRSTVRHDKIIINSFDERIKQHKEIFAAALAGSFSVFKIPVDPVFRKAQEHNIAPQLYKVRGRGLKPVTVSAIQAIDAQIWR